MFDTKALKEALTEKKIINVKVLKPLLQVQIKWSYNEDIRTEKEQ